MFCPKCGSKLNEGDAFCGKCGAPVRKKAVAGDGASGSGDVPKASHALTSAPSPSTTQLATVPSGKKGRGKLVVAVAIALILVIGGAYTVLAKPSASKSATPEKPVTASESTVKDEELDNDMVKVTDVKIERVDPKSYPEALLGRYSSLGNESLYRVTGKAENRADYPVVSSMVLTGKVSYTDKYGDDKVEDTTFSTGDSGSPSSAITGGDSGSFVLAPKEKRDVTVFCTWQDSTLTRSGSEDSEYILDTKTVKLQKLKTEAENDSRAGLLTVDDKTVSLIGDSGITTASGGYGNVKVGPSVQLTNSTSTNAEKMYLYYTYSYDGQESPYRGYLEAEYVKAGKTIEMTSGKTQDGEVPESEWDGFDYSFSGSDDGSDGRMKLVPLAVYYQVD